MLGPVAPVPPEGGRRRKQKGREEVGIGFEFAADASSSAAAAAAAGGTRCIPSPVLRDHQRGPWIASAEWRTGRASLGKKGARGLVFWF